MNAALTELKTFLEDARKNGTDCISAEEKLTSARNLLQVLVNGHDRSVLERIVAELEQIHVLCSLPKQCDCSDDCECGV
ncbi:MAG: hypothetical protein HYT94_00745 [Parcubacteria group bacterium]|nr:hypothetical protein [Parcubacteria group bacterium]